MSCKKIRSESSPGIGEVTRHVGVETGSHLYSEMPTGVDAQRFSESPAPIQSGPRPCAGDGHLSVGFVFRQIDEVDIRERNMPESDSSRPEGVKFTRMAMWHGSLHEEIRKSLEMQASAARENNSYC